MDMDLGQSLKGIFDHVKVGDVMRTPVQTIYDTQNMSDALTKLRTQPMISYLIVLDKSDRLVGILSHKYFYRTQSPRKAIATTDKYDPELVWDGSDSFYERTTLNRYILKQVVKQNPYYLHPSDTLSKAVINMAGMNLGCIPIVDDKLRVKGILTDREVLKYLSGILEE